MKVLITGAQGQLGREAVLAFERDGYDVIGLGREQLDLIMVDKVADAIAAYGADWVVQCAAYTQVDKAEEDAELAFRINRDAARAVAEGARTAGSRLLQLSTDFVFSGEQSHPYQEDDKANPLGVYGQSKLEGERAVLAAFPDALILRTSWVYGEHGSNFVKTILRLASGRKELRVVDDQIGTPTWTRDIVSAMSALMAINAAGIYHYTNEGVASWYDFSHAILHIAESKGLLNTNCITRPIPSSDYPTPAHRPQYSVLSKLKIRRVLDIEIPHWRDSLEKMLDTPGR